MWHYKIWYKVELLARLILFRSTAAFHRLRGARIGRKCGIGRRVRLNRPWTIAIGQRTTLEDDVIIKVEHEDAAVSIGEFSYLGKGCFIDATHSVSIGSRTLIAPSVFITDHNHNTDRDRTIVDQGCSSRPVRIEDDVWIGVNAVILPGVIIQRGAVIAAGAVVTKTVPEYEIWGGVPASKIRVRTSLSGGVVR